MVLLLVTFAGSDIVGPALLPILWGPPTYINPIILATAILYGSLGLVTMMRANDRGWPLFAGAIGLYIALVSFEDSILQWFVFQLGAATIGNRVDAVQITAAAATLGVAVLMHANQLGRRVRQGLVERGLDPRELAEVEEHSHREARSVVLRLVGVVGAAALILFVAQFALLRARLGINMLGILVGLLIVTVIATMTFRILKEGPVPGMRPEEAPAKAERREQRRPPAGLRPR